MTRRTGLRADAARNREAILEAARTVFVAHGPEAGMDDIAAKAGVAVGTLYRHFPTKQDLIQTIAEGLGAAIAATLDAAVLRIADGHSTALDEILALIRRVVVEMGHERLLRAALSEVAPDPFQAMREQAKESVERMIAMAHQARAVRPDLTVDDVILLLNSSPGVETAKSDRERWLELVEGALSGQTRRLSAKTP
ncbi:TetR/AcrR family transcriptional regulator [Amycolatopsis sp. NPDC059027]|uniref:TetR/AcrR family transcriptional regulator n=1 Tax=Amycolatopsis sp. NPDC059027 TaxID=3346709 RepID=UPI0036702D99